MSLIENPIRKDFYKSGFVFFSKRQFRLNLRARVVLNLELILNSLNWISRMSTIISLVTLKTTQLRTIYDCANIL